MKCFYHRDKDAVGICRSCHKALCPDCAADIGNVLACKGKCEEKVKELNNLVENNIKAYGTTLPQCFRNVMSYGIIAFIISGTGLIGLLEKYRDLLFLEIVGLFLFAIAGMNFLWGLAYYRSSKKN